MKAALKYMNNENPEVNLKLTDFISEYIQYLKRLKPIPEKHVKLANIYIHIYIDKGTEALSA